jgi:hypothetical protein
VKLAGTVGGCKNCSKVNYKSASKQGQRLQINTYLNLLIQTAGTDKHAASVADIQQDMCDEQQFAKVVQAVVDKTGNGNGLFSPG